ncbi:Dabb family protein [Aeoliella mucimassa]|uniref:Stress responsive A/B Barrel Domain protein n=1 Tax=Aeoliella mucimassa TaxID=2527972 RepID=A0A518ASV5_9BACT|nr:Dabb family protein [Aeoliella mucimassa]QDU57821.1 Stress responsive A/B Barrel Domain protein [Aeoliella mucimassa]
MSDTSHLPVVHSVYFSLADNSQANVDALIADCNHYLTGHDGVLFFAAGTQGEGFDRPVNDHDFDVALLVVFDNRAAHDAYQTAPRHLEFIEKNKPTWAKVRVFDSVAK